MLKREINIFTDFIFIYLFYLYVSVTYFAGYQYSLLDHLYLKLLVRKDHLQNNAVQRSSIRLAEHLLKHFFSTVNMTAHQ